MTVSSKTGSGPGRGRPLVATAAMLVAISCQDVTVTTVAVDRIEVEPPTAQVQVNGSLRLTARVLSESGQELSGRNIAWTSLNPAVADVDGGGNVTAVAPGTAPIRATAEGVAAEATIMVTAAPTIAVAPQQVSFSAEQNGASPGDRTVAVTNSGTGSLAGLTATVRYPSGQASGWLSRNLSSTTAPATLILSASQSGLAAGTYNATVDVASNVATNSPVSVPVTFTVQSAPPAISLDPASVTFTATAGGGDPSSRTVQVSNGGSGTLGGLSTSISYPGQGGGWLSASLSGSTAPATITLNATTGSLSPGTYQATVRVASGQASNSPQDIQVGFTVSGSDPDNPPGVPGDVTATRVALTRIQVTWTPPGGQDRYEIRRRLGTGGSWTFDATAPGDATGYQDNAVLPGFTYQYQVRACSAAGCSNYSNPATVSGSGG